MLSLRGAKRPSNLNAGSEIASPPSGIRKDRPPCPQRRDLPGCTCHTRVSPTMKNNPWIHGFAVFTSLATWFLLLAGAMVTSTGSGLAVPDWPLSFGTWMPPMVGGVFFEHGHRMVAGSVAICMVCLCGFLLAWEERGWVKALGVLGVAMVVTQALLGGLTVLLRLPTSVSVSHAILGQSFFCLTLILACVTSSVWETRAPGYRPADKGLFFFSLCLSMAFFVQLFSLSGASVRHLHAGLAIPDFPTVFGGIFPPFWTVPITFHFLHRMMAYALLFFCFVFATRILLVEKTDRVRVFLATIWFGLLTVQLTLGALTIWLRRPPLVASLHLVIGALCLAVSVLLSFRLGWASIPAPRTGTQHWEKGSQPA